MSRKKPVEVSDRAVGAGRLPDCENASGNKQSIAEGAGVSDKSSLPVEESTRPFRFDDEYNDTQDAHWRLTIVWHPDVSRIGAIACVPDTGEPLIVGRGSPVFVTQAGAETVLGDLCLSRQALVVSSLDESESPSAWIVERPAGASRLRIEGRDCNQSVMLAESDLVGGLSLALADRTLLLLSRSFESIERGNSESVPSLIGVSPAMHDVRRAVCEMGASGDDVLLIGPTGCGKELIAQALHERGKRASGPWVAVNMAAIPPDLATATLFGARRGAFTGADAHRSGFFQQASGGTLFLDEIGDAPASLQPLLLRALQEREVQVVGGRVEAVDVRVVSAMERDPDDPDFPFRGALRHRLAVQELRVPALVDRREDIGLLVVALCNAHTIFESEQWPPAESNIPRWLRLIELFMAFSWPGNVRELRHALSQIAAASNGATLRIPPALLQRLRNGLREDIRQIQGHVDVTNAGKTAAVEPSKEAQLEPGTHAREPQRDFFTAEEDGPAAPAPTRRLADLDDDDLYDAWMDAKCEVAELARRLGASRTSLYRRIESSPRCRLAADIPLGELLNALDECRGDLQATAERLSVSRRGLEARMRASGASSPDLAQKNK